VPFVVIGLEASSSTALQQIDGAVPLQFRDFAMSFMFRQPEQAHVLSDGCRNEVQLARICLLADSGII
jgi:hypothetical protein